MNSISLRNIGLYRFSVCSCIYFGNIYQGICSFHLSFGIYWHKVELLIVFFDVCRICNDVSSFLPHIGYLCLFIFFHQSGLGFLNWGQFCTLPPGGVGHLAISGDIFSYYNLGHPVDGGQGCC